MIILINFLSTTAILAALDILFLGIIAREFYQNLMSQAITIKFNLFYAFGFYLLYTLGIFIFVLYPYSIQNPDLQNVILYGALFGFFCYMTYDLTNMATIKDWPLKIIFVDIFWGTFVTGLVSTISYFIYQFLK